MPGNHIIAATSINPPFIETSMDHWTEIPDKIKSIDREAKLEIRVYWDQVFRLTAYSKSIYQSLDLVLLHSPAGRVLDQGIAYNGHAWKEGIDELFRAEYRIIRESEKKYIDISEALKCQWSGNWVFSDRVLEKRRNGKIDFGYYYSNAANLGIPVERLQSWESEVIAKKLDLPDVWRLFTPSGQIVWELATVIQFDGNTTWFILEGDTEFVEIYYSGS